MYGRVRKYEKYMHNTAKWIIKTTLINNLEYPEVKWNK